MAKGFDPDAYLKSKAATGGFDPDAYLSSKKIVPMRTAEGESIARGAAQGLSFGFADELTGAGEAALDYAKAAVEPLNHLTDDNYEFKSPGDFKELYAKYRDESRANYDKSQRDNPGLYMAGELGGALGSAFIPGLGFANAAKGATTAARIGRAAASGALTGMGTTEADPTKSPEQLGEFLQSAGLGAATGAAFQGGSEAVGKGISKLKQGAGKYLDQLSDWNTLKAAGAMTKDRKAMRHQGVSKDVADYLRKKGIVTFGSTVDDAVERSKPLQSAAREEISDALMQLDDHLMQSAKLEPVAIEMASPAVSVNASRSFPEATGEITKLNRVSGGFNPKQVGERIQAELIEPMKNGPKAAKRIAEQLQEEVDDLIARGDSMSFVDANKLKGKLDDIIGDYGREKSPYIEGLKKFRGIFNNAMEESADEVAKASGNPALSESWKQAKKDFRMASTVQDMAANRADQIRTNNPFGLTDYVLGGGAAAAGLAGDDPTQAAMGIPLMLGNRLARSRGPAALGVSAKALSNFLKNPPAGMQKYVQVLSNAAKRGNTALTATHYMLMQDPEYRKAIGE